MFYLAMLCVAQTLQHPRPCELIHFTKSNVSGDNQLNVVKLTNI